MSQVVCFPHLYGKPKNPLPRRLRSHYISAEFLSREEIQVKLSISILWLCFLFILALIIQRQEYYQVISSFEGIDVFVICIMFSTTGAFSVLLIRNKPKLAVLRRCCFILSVVSMASALSILGYALFLESFRWVYRGLNCGKMNISAFRIWRNFLAKDFSYVP